MWAGSTQHRPLAINLECKLPLAPPPDTSYLREKQQQEREKAILAVGKIPAECKSIDQIEQVVEEVTKVLTYEGSSASNGDPTGRRGLPPEYLKEIFRLKKRLRSTNPLRAHERNRIRRAIRKVAKEGRMRAKVQRLEGMGPHSNFWKILKQSFGPPNGKSRERSLSTNPEEDGHLARSFAEGYAKVTKTAASLPIPPPSQSEPLSMNELKIVVSDLRKSSTPGEDGISNRVLDAALKDPAASKTIFNLMSSCVKLGYFPTKWRSALLLPIPKPGKKEFRPISLLSSLGKILERILLNRLRSGRTRALLPLRQDRTSNV